MYSGRRAVPAPALVASRMLRTLFRGANYRTTHEEVQRRLSAVAEASWRRRQQRRELMPTPIPLAA